MSNFKTSFYIESERQQFFLKKEKIKVYRFNWSPRLYWRYAVTKRPARVTGISPSTMPDKSASTIKVQFFEI